MKMRVNEAILCAGFGGQGIMVLGKVLATAGMTSGYAVTYLPSYGVEVRGGTAYAMVKISSTAVASPVARYVDTAVIMNQPSLDRFEASVKKGGLLILNSSMADGQLTRKDIEIVRAGLTEEAIELGSGKVANMIAAGIFIARRPVFDKSAMVKVIQDMAGGRKELIDINIKAVERGIEIGRK